MTNPLTLKLEHGASLNDDDRAELDQLVGRRSSIKPGQDLICEGDRPEEVHLVMGGVACRYKMLKNGRRSIMALLVPGDFCDLHVAILDEMDHNIGTLTECSIVEVPRSRIDDLLDTRPRIARALFWATLVDEAILREWLVNMGQRPADRQMAHLFAELLVRLQAVRLADDNSYEFPITQHELGDILGMSTVHVNRSLQELRRDGLVELRGGKITIPDVGRLNTFAAFEPNYLHLSHRRDGSLEVEQRSVSA